MKRRPSEPEPEYGFWTFFALMMLPLTFVAAGKLLFRFGNLELTGIGMMLGIASPFLMMIALFSCTAIAAKRWPPLGGLLAFLGIGPIYYGVLHAGIRWVNAM